MQGWLLNAELALTMGWNLTNRFEKIPIYPRTKFPKKSSLEIFQCENLGRLNDLKI